MSKDSGKYSIDAPIDASAVSMDATRRKRLEEWKKESAEEEKLYHAVMDQLLEADFDTDDVFIYKVMYTRSFEKGPKPWRRIAVRGDNTLDEMLMQIIEAFGMEVDHMYALYPKSIRGVERSGVWSNFVFYTDTWEDSRYETYKLPDFEVREIKWDEFPKWSMLFDFGDEHTFNIVFEKIVPMDEYYDKFPKNKIPAVAGFTILKSVGEDIVQYPDWDFEDDYDPDDE